MTPSLFGEDGKALKLGSRIGKGGEGEVYAIDGADRVVKFYTATDKHTREPKIRLMIAHQLAQKSSLVAFPISMVFDKARKFAGFTMAKISAHQPLHELYSPGARKVAFPAANYRFLVLAAANIARAVGMAHSNSCVIGDINHSGILVSDKATVTLIDADSFQVTDGRSYFHCKVGVPEYTPPELQQKQLGTIVRTDNHDAFGLAVVIFQLLFMGRHPYSGAFSKGEMPLEKAISEHRFAYSNRRSVGMSPPPGVPTLNDFPAAIGNAFEAAFSLEGMNSRPTAKQWMGLLDTLEKNLVQCGSNKLHHYPNGAKECPWCRMERRFSVPLFLPALANLPGGATIIGPTAGDVLTIWRTIEAVRPPTPSPFPTFTGNAYPSDKANKMRFARMIAMGLGGLAIAAGVIIAFTQRGAFLPGVILAAIGFGVVKYKPSDVKEIEQQYKLVATSLGQLQADWDHRSSGSEFQSHKAALKAKKDAYDDLPAEQKRRLDEYARNRAQFQRDQYLRSQLIRNFKIAGIGAGRRAILLSFGIETAADVSPQSILRIQGFGPKTAEPLIRWKAEREAAFRFNPNSTAADTVAQNTIRAEIAQRAAQLKADLSVGPAKLSQLAATTNAQQEVSRSILGGVLEAHAQAVANMKALRLALPSIPKASVSNSAYVNASASTPVVAASQGVPATSSIACPSCGGNMVIRLARKGRHAGNKFYGCVRYPSCTGTRNFP